MLSDRATCARAGQVGVADRVGGRDPEFSNVYGRTLTDWNVKWYITRPRFLDVGDCVQEYAVHTLELTLGLGRRVIYQTYYYDQNINEGMICVHRIKIRRWYRRPSTCARNRIKFCSSHLSSAWRSCHGSMLQDLLLDCFSGSS